MFVVHVLGRDTSDPKIVLKKTFLAIVEGLRVLKIAVFYANTAI